MVRKEATEEMIKVYYPIKWLPVIINFVMNYKPYIIIMLVVPFTTVYPRQALAL